MSKWYEIRAKAKADDTTEVLVYGDIGESWWSDSVTAAQFVKDLQGISSANLTVRINSFGGSVPDGIAIYNALRRYPGAVTVEIDGVALSIASLIAMAGRTVRMAENAMFMIHAPWTVAAGNSTEMREQADLLDKFAEAMTSSYVSKSGMSRDDVLALLTDGADHWYTAAEAQAAGFIDEISEPVAVAAAARFDSKRFKSVPAAAAAFLAKQEQSMADKNPAAPVTAPSAAPAAPYARSADESAHVCNMFAAFRGKPGVDDLLVDVLKDPALTPDAASQRLLAHLGKDTTPARPAGAVPQVETLHDEEDKRREAAVTALMARAAVLPKGQQANLSANPFRGHRLMDFARASLSRAGIKTDGMTSMEIVGAAFTQGTSDFPILLENTLGKTLQAAYATTPDTWSRFCAVGSVSDFRVSPRYRVGSLANIDLVNELAEFKYRAIPDGERATIQAVTKGNIISLSRQSIINDDLGAFVGLAAAFGRAARRTIEADVYALLGLNSNNGPTMPDGQPLFHSTHGNLAASGAVPGVTVLDLARAAMASQRDVSLNDFLDLRPSVGLFTMAQGGNARVLNSSVYDPDATNRLQRPNMVAGLLNDIVDSPRVPGTSWYLFADPQVAPAIEVAFLEGVQEPFMEMQEGFDVDGARWKVRLDYGVAAVDWRPAYRNPGA
jgi:ATP-dependent protease ClpP protease subunit